MNKRTLRPMLIERADGFWRRCERGADDECWPWTASIGHHGYGRVTYRVGSEHVYFTAHQAAYMIGVGDIPEGMEIDHICGTTGCVNPRHLEPVTNAENMRRKWRHRPGVNISMRSGNYRVRWNEFPNGVRTQRARTFRDEAEAKAFAARVAEQIREAGEVA